MRFSWKSCLLWNNEERCSRTTQNTHDNIIWRMCIACWITNATNAHSGKVIFTESCVYWNVHHLDSWVKRDQLDVTRFIISLFNAHHVSDVNTSILRSLRLMCWVILWVVLVWFDVCWCYVAVWLWWCGIRTQAEALVVWLRHHHNHTTT